MADDTSRDAAKLLDLSRKEMTEVHGGNAGGPGPVLMVISNQDFYHREYFETR